MRTILVGLDPGRNGTEPLDPAYPSGKRLADLAGLSGKEFLARFDRVNLHHERGRPVREDGPLAANLLPVLRGRRVVALGRRVSDALGVGEGRSVWADGVDWSITSGGFVGATLPHPSGLSRWWNDPEHEESARSFMRSLLLPCVYVEGPDGSGKTTLIGELANVLPSRYPALLPGMTLVPTDDPPKSWDECLARIQRRLAPGLLCDRSSGLLSELVYAPVLRGGVLAPGGEGEMWGMVESLLHAVTFVYCLPSLDSLDPTFRPEEDPAHVKLVKAKSRELLARYDEVMARVSSMGGRVVRYDFMRDTPEEVSACVV